MQVWMALPLGLEPRTSDLENRKRVAFSNWKTCFFILVGIYWARSRRVCIGVGLSLTDFPAKFGDVGILLF